MSQSCRYLGLIDDSKTNANFPSSSNACHAVDPPFVVALDYQRSRCLRETHSDCPGFVKGWESGVPKSISYSSTTPTTKKIVTNKWVWIAIASISALILLIGFTGWIPGLSFPFLNTPDHSASLSLLKTTYTPTSENTTTYTPNSEETNSGAVEQTSQSTEMAASETITRTRIPTRTNTITPTSTNTLTITPTRFQFGIPTNTLQPTSFIPPIVSTSEPTSTITNTPTPTPTKTNTITLTSTNTSTATSTRTITPTKTNTRTRIPTRTQTPTTTNTPTITLTPTVTNTPTITNTITPTGTNTITPTATDEPTTP